MSVAEAPAIPMFGQITAEQLRDNVDLARHVLGVVNTACRHSKGRFTALSVAQGLRSGAMQLYGVLRTDALEAAVVSQVRDGVFEVLVAGPDFEDVAPFMDVLEKFARQQRCERMAIWGPQFFKKHLGEGWFAREVRFERVFAD